MQLCSIFAVRTKNIFLNHKFRIVGVARRCWFIRLRHAVFVQTYVKQKYIVLNDLRAGEKGCIFVVQKQKQHMNVQTT